MTPRTVAFESKSATATDNCDPAPEFVKNTLPLRE
jgi:hypothetical protein